MTSDIKKINVIDPRMEVLSQLEYGIKKGPMQNNYHQFPAQSESKNNIFINVQTPSVRSIISRVVLLESTINVRIDLPVVTGTTRQPYPSEVEFALSNFEGFGPFPIQSSIQNAQCEINGNRFNVNMQEILPAILATVSDEELQRYNGSCPTMRDKLFNYDDGILSLTNNVLAGFNNAVGSKLIPRGAIPMSVTSHYINGTTGTFDPRQSPAINNLAFTVNHLIVSLRSVEPLLISPFNAFECEHDKQGLYNIENMNFNFNMDQSASRAYRVGHKIFNGTAIVDRQYNYTYSIDSFTNTNLLFNFMTPHNNIMLPPRTILPYTKYDFYSYHIGEVNAGQTKTIVNTDTLQMNTIPHKLYCWVRPFVQDVYTSDCYLTINSININFNNSAGILSNATQTELWNISVKNKSQQSYVEFIGSCASYVNRTAPYVSNTSVNIPSSGSMLILEFGSDIEINSEWYAPGSDCQTNLLLTMSVTNNQTAFDPLSIDAATLRNNKKYTGLGTNNKWMMILMTEQQGIIALEQNRCESYTTMLSVQDVLNTKSTDPVEKDIL